MGHADEARVDSQVVTGWVTVGKWWLDKGLICVFVVFGYGYGGMSEKEDGGLFGERDERR